MSIAGDLAEERCEKAFEVERAAFREELDRYRKVAEAALMYRRGWEAFWGPDHADMPDQAEANLDAALAAVGMKVEE